MKIIILGAGIVGLTMANLLAQVPELQISLIAPNPKPDSYSNTDYDIRCSAITHASQRVFNNIGIWQNIIAERAAAYHSMLIWEHSPEIKLHFSSESINAPNLGHIIENRIINTALYNNLLNKSNVVIISGVASALQYNKDCVKIVVNSQEITGKLIVGADGASSWLRTAANIPAHCVDYNHEALVSCVESSLPHNNVAMQRFMPEGILAFLPLSMPNYSNIVWSSTPEVIQELRHLDDNIFCERLANSFDNMLGEVRLHGTRLTFPLRMLHATQYVLPRIALIGDAAHVIHPLAGQGLNLGILDAENLASRIYDAVIENRDIGALSVLRKYERSRKGHNLCMLALVGGLKKIFATENIILKNMRNHGMYTVDSSNAAKNFMMRFALGI